MIGRVLYGGGSIIATLNGRDDWSVILGNKPDARLARGLESYYRDHYQGPADGHYGQLILKDLAERTGGTMVIEDFPPAGPDEIN